MSRSERLLDLLQVLRRYSRPVAGRVLAEETGISLRTLYRDIASLQARGAWIEGEPGVGYILRPGFVMPPLMFTPDEADALVLGMRWVASSHDETLSLAARNALAKIGAVLPDPLKRHFDGSTLFVGPREDTRSAGIDLSAIITAMRGEQKLVLAYRDQAGAVTERTVWPFALGFFERVRVLVAWCELRQGFRHFRTDRMMRLDATDVRYPRRRPVLLKEWRESEGIALSDESC